MNSSRNTLLNIVNGDISSLKKGQPSIVDGPRLTNAVWKKLLKKYEKDGLTERQIIDKFITIDGYIESGKLTEELVRSKMQ